MLTYGHLCLRSFFFFLLKTKYHILFNLSYSVWNQDSNLNPPGDSDIQTLTFIMITATKGLTQASIPCKHHGDGWHNHVHRTEEVTRNRRDWDLLASKWHMWDLNWALTVFKVPILCMCLQFPGIIMISISLNSNHSVPASAKSRPIYTVVIEHLLCSRHSGLKTLANQKRISQSTADFTRLLEIYSSVFLP